ncbi:MAG: gamma-glutamylcyclotransferase [Comamonadaceae bacterium]|nr:MAG: gamma-glutamylcyclotransferase [Comamonadaceae bacterium]
MTAPHPSLPTASHVFVYGTLRRGDVRDITRLQPAPRFIGYASVSGQLYHLGSYPGIVLGGEVDVKGEIYAITPELERTLDEIEEVWPQQTGEYAKRVIAVRLGEVSLDAVAEFHGRATLDCIIYEISPDRTVNQMLIEGGDWLAISR